MDEVQKEMIETVSAVTSRDILHFCVRHLVKGKNKDFEQDEKAKLTECLNNFSYAYVLVADSWTKQINENMRSAD